MISNEDHRERPAGCELCRSAAKARCGSPKAEAAPSFESRAGEYLDVAIVGRRVEADRIVSFSLAPTNGGQLPHFEAGAHIDVHVGTGAVRQYSLFGDPANRQRYEIAVLLEANSRGGSAAIHRTFQVGRRIRIGVPRNNFRMAKDARRSILVAGGIGVTPLVSMMRVLQAAEAEYQVYYAARSPERAALLDVLSLPQFAPRVSIHYSNGVASDRICAADVLPSFGQGSHLYTCGPRAFMDSVIAAAAARGWPSDCIHVEHFSAAAPAEGGEFTVRAVRSGVSVRVRSGETIAGALAGAGVVVDVSCQQGICGSCLVRVVSGVPDHQDLYLDQKEREANDRITVCCSRALTEELVLEI